MARVAESIRRATTFLVAVLLWTHALLFLNIQSPAIHGAARLLRLTSSEIALFALLLSFSFLAASGFWRTLRSLAYIYFFPFVLSMYLLYLCFVLVRATHRWLSTQGRPRLGEVPVLEQRALTIPQAQSTGPETAGKPSRNVAELVHFLARPFRRFTFLWCILLVVATHAAIVWLSLVIVLIHLARRIGLILKMLLFSDPWLREVGARILSNLNSLLAGLAAVTGESSPTAELKNLWNQLSSYRRILDFLRDPYVLSRWAWVLGIAFLGSVYIYMAVLFSFGYYGIARVSGVQYPWPDALVTSVFIPFFISDLPKMLALKVLGGIHCSLVVVVGVGTIMNFLRRKLDAVCAASVEISNRLREPEIHKKYLILEEKFSSGSGPSPGGDEK
jgi:hypothetical protein